MADVKSAVELHRDFSKTLESVYRKLIRLERMGISLEQQQLLQAVHSLRGDLSPMESIVDSLLVKANTDGLTQLKSRAYFEEWLKKKIRGIRHVGCIMTDIDNFGAYNNSYGHPQGDCALRTVARVVQSAAHTDYVTRYGGEEFSIILAEYDNVRSDLRERAEAVRLGVENTVIPLFDVSAMTALCAQRTGRRTPSAVVRVLRNAEQSSRATYVTAIEVVACSSVAKFFARAQGVTVSVGAATREHGETIDHLIYRTDKALYAAKKAGRNRVVIADQ